MKHAGMQPYFFPYIGYFDLINRVDLWIIYDVSQFTRNWEHRNRVLHPSTGWQYIIVPLKKHDHTSAINQIEVANDIDWKTKIFKQLQHYKKEAPYYSQVIHFLEDCFSETDSNLSKLNESTIQKTCQLLEIKTPIKVFSEMRLPIEPDLSAEERVIGICQAVGADELINAPGGVALYHPDKFSEKGIKLTFQTYVNMIYPCGHYQFESGLSIIDVMMWNSCEKIKSYLDNLRSDQSLQ
jgi:WbqC-like protein family